MPPRGWLPIGLLALTSGLSACASGAAVAARPEPFPGAARPTVADRPSVPMPESPGLPGPAVPSAVLETALALRGVRYQFGGENPAVGFDCSGVVRYVFEQHAVRLPRTVTEQFLVGRDVEIALISPGDLIFFSTVAPGASHVGIALDGGTFVHAPGSGSVIRVDRIDTPYWRSRLVGVRRLLALTIG